MTMSVHANFPSREPRIQSYLLFGAIFPCLVAVGGLSRVFARETDDDERPRPARKSLFAEARTNASIATSYILMARAMLH